MSAVLKNTVRKSQADGPIDLLATLLAEQKDFTAVERFSNWHDQKGDSTRPNQEKYYQRLLPTSAPVAGEQYAFEVDLDACSGCKACVVACHNLNGLHSSETWRNVGLMVTQSDLPIVQHVTTGCHHCADPGCLAGCPVNAYEKETVTGIVRHLDDQCIGCKYCTMMCPYEVPQYNASLGIVRKCDMCSQRLATGEAPACVQACPNSAIKIIVSKSKPPAQSVDLNKAVAIESSNNCLVPGAPPNSWTRPTTQFRTKRPQHVLLQAVDCVADEPQESHLPLVAMLVLSQVSVGGICAVVASAWLGAISAGVQQWGTFAAVLCGVVGIHLAILHLGRPWLAFRVCLGWRTSWLSREAIAFGAYMALGSIALLCNLPDSLSTMLPQSMTWLIPKHFAETTLLLTAVVGLVSVASSAMIYVATRRHLWSMQRTMSQFFGTAIVSGFASTSLLLGTEFRVYSIGCAALALAASIFAIWPLLQCYLLGQRQPKMHSDFVVRSGRLMHKTLKIHCASLRVALGSAVALLGTAFLLSPLQGVYYGLLVGMMVLLLAGQLVARTLYFASVVTYRMPGAQK
jgi:formate dehydrogenase iron-sulfur subunit